jgi:hypothetical protein
MTKNNLHDILFSALAQDDGQSQRAIAMEKVRTAFFPSYDYNGKKLKWYRPLPENPQELEIAQRIVGTKDLYSLLKSAKLIERESQGPSFMNGFTGFPPVQTKGYSISITPHASQKGTYVLTSTQGIWKPD